MLYLGDHYEVENGIGIKYIFGGNLRLAMIKGSLTSYFHKDHLGSTAAVTDQTGAKVEGTQYEPFGSTRTHEGTDVSSYKFTDQEVDNETNLYNYDARLYDPVLGMFVTPDSWVPDFTDLKNGRVFDPQYLNRYAYCRNNPLIYTDPNGHQDTYDGSGGMSFNELMHIGEYAIAKEEAEALKEALANMKDMIDTHNRAVKNQDALKKAYGEEVVAAVLGQVNPQTTADIKAMEAAMQVPDSFAQHVIAVKQKIEEEFNIKPAPGLPTPKSVGDYDNDKDNPSNPRETPKHHDGGSDVE